MGREGSKGESRRGGGRRNTEIKVPSTFFPFFSHFLSFWVTTCESATGGTVHEGDSVLDMPAPSLTSAFVSVADYLATVYEPDCDYLEGQLEERNLGERTHAKLQARLTAFLLTRYEPAGFEVFTEIRVQVSASRFRVPDICVTAGDPGEEILTRAPFLCIEILSPEDRMSRIESRISDYLRMGVAFVWVLDPLTRQAYVATATKGLREVTDGILRTENPVLEAPLVSLFA